MRKIQRAVRSWNLISDSGFEYFESVYHYMLNQRLLCCQASPTTFYPFELEFENQMQHSLGQLLRERRGWETNLYQRNQTWPGVGAVPTIGSHA